MQLSFSFILEFYTIYSNNSPPLAYSIIRYNYDLVSIISYSCIIFGCRSCFKIYISRDILYTSDYSIIRLFSKILIATYLIRNYFLLFLLLEYELLTLLFQKYLHQLFFLYILLIFNYTNRILPHIILLRGIIFL